MATIGIDLGTTYCCVAAKINGQIEIIPAANGESTTPSYVAFDEGGNAAVGDAARAAGMNYPQRTIYDIKRMMGQPLSDPLIQEYSKLWPFHLTEENSRVRVRIDWNQYSPEMLSTEILKHLKEQAELFLNDSVKKAVVSVPAYFNEEQKELTRKACADAGLEVLQLLSEPAAAAIAFHHKNLERMHGKGKQNCVIFDFGGGTLDVAVITFEDEEIFIRKIGGDPNLGGEDIDTKLMEHCLNEFKAKHGIDLLVQDTWPVNDLGKRAQVLRRLKLHCQQQKTYLSAASRVVVGIDAIYGTTKLAVPVTREKFEEINVDIFQKCIDTTKRVLQESGLDVSDVNQVILVGGSSRIPKIQQLLEKLFGFKLTKSIIADEAIARGAAIQASRIVNNEKVVLVKESYRMSSVVKDESDKLRELENLVGNLKSEVSILELQNLVLKEDQQRRESKVDPSAETLKEENQVNVRLEGREYKSIKFPSNDAYKMETEELKRSEGNDIGIYLDSEHLICGTFDVRTTTVKTLLAGRFLLDQKLGRLVEKKPGNQDAVDVFQVIRKKKSQNLLNTLTVGTLMEDYFTAIKRRLEENGCTINHAIFTALCDLPGEFKNPIEQAGIKVFTNFLRIKYPVATVVGFTSGFHLFAQASNEVGFVVKNEDRCLEIFSEKNSQKSTSVSCSYSLNGKGDLVCGSSEVKDAFQDYTSKLYRTKGLFIFSRKNTALKDQPPVYVLGEMMAHFSCRDDLHVLPFCGVSILAHPTCFKEICLEKSTI